MTAGGRAAGGTAVEAVLADLSDALDRLSGLALWQAGEPDLTALAVGLDRAQRRVEGQTLRLLGEVDGRGIPGREGTKNVGSWLVTVLPDVHPGAAGALGRRAERLYRSAVAAELAPTRAAVEAGALRSYQERLLVQTVQQVTPPNLPADHPDAVPAETVEQAQQFLLDQAPQLTWKHYRQVVAELRHALDPTADDRLAHDEAAQQRARTLTLVTEDSGMTFVQGLLTKECGAALKTALDAWSAPQPAQDGTLDPRTPGQRRHDALHQLADTTLTHDRVPSSHGSPVRVIVRTTAETLTLATTGTAGTGAAGTGAAFGLTPLTPLTPPPAELDDGTPISRQTLSRLACGAELVPVLVDDLGNPLDVGRTHRLHTAKQRIALAERDRGCTLPGCTAPVSWCEAHHLTAWEHGGHTTVDDGALLCPNHHHHVHATGATGRVIDGHVVWDLTGQPPDHPAHQLRPTGRHLLHHLLRQWLTPRRE